MDTLKPLYYLLFMIPLKMTCDIYSNALPHCRCSNQYINRTLTKVVNSSPLITTYSHQGKCDSSRGMTREGLEGLITCAPWINLSKFYFNVIRLDQMISKVSEQKLKIREPYFSNNQVISPQRSVNKTLLQTWRGEVSGNAHSASDEGSMVNTGSIIHLFRDYL